MILDQFKLHSLVFQVVYDDAYELWDAAGAVSRELSKIWGELKVSDAKPQQQVLSGKDVVINTSLQSGIVKLMRERAQSSGATNLLAATYRVWREVLSLKLLTRVSARHIYRKEFDSIDQANAYIRGLDLVRWPSSDVFNLSPSAERSGPDVTFRFQDDKAFSVVRMKADRISAEVELDPEFFERSVKSESIHVLIDFDRGVTGKMEAEKLNIEEWFKGYRHVLRRDIQAVVGEVR